MEQMDFNFKLHMPMLYKLLVEDKYFSYQGIAFTLHEEYIEASGRIGYCKSILKSFKDVDNIYHHAANCRSSYYSAFMLLEGVSFHRILDKGRELLKNLEI